MATYIDNNGHTNSTINIYPELATVKVRMLPGYRHWSRPDSALVRRWIDAAIADSEIRNRRRTGRIQWTTTSAGWYGRVELVQS